MAIPTYPRQKDPQVMLHKIRDKKDQSSHVYLRFLPSPSHVRYRIKYVVCVTHEKQLTRLNWSIDKLSCKNLFELIVVDLFHSLP